MIGDRVLLLLKFCILYYNIKNLNCRILFKQAVYNNYNTCSKMIHNMFFLPTIYSSERRSCILTTHTHTHTHTHTCGWNWTIIPHIFLDDSLNFYTFTAYRNIYMLIFIIIDLLEGVSPIIILVNSSVFEHLSYEKLKCLLFVRQARYAIMHRREPSQVFLWGLLQYYCRI